MSKKQTPDAGNPFLALDKSRFAKDRSTGGGHKQKQTQAAEVKALLKAAAKAKAEQSDEDDNYFASVMNFGGVNRLPKSAKIARQTQADSPPVEKGKLRDQLFEPEAGGHDEAAEFAAALGLGPAKGPASDFVTEEVNPRDIFSAPQDKGALKRAADLNRHSSNTARAGRNQEPEGLDAPLRGLLAGVKIGSDQRRADSKNFDPDLSRDAEEKVYAAQFAADFLPAKGKQSASAGLEQQTSSLPDDDEFLFVEAMNAVAPLKSSGRAVVPPPLASGAVIAPSNPLQDFMDGKVEFSLAHTDEYVEGHVLGLDPAVVVKMRAGAYSFEAHLDLHGLNAAQAFDALVAFIRSSYQRGLRNVLVIPGRGKNSPDGFGPLRDKVQEWFTQEPFKRVVLAFCTAQARHGGPGALYVLLRKFKKSRGKVFWDKRPSDPDLFV